MCLRNTHGARLPKRDSSVGIFNARNTVNAPLISNASSLISIGDYASYRPLGFLTVYSGALTP